MADVMDVQVSSLLFDEENPRLPSPNQGQREVLRALANNQGSKLRILAEDILAFGLDPSDLMVVLRVEGPDNRFVVLDGNRRLSALRALENPELVAGAVSSQVLNALRRSSKGYQDVALDSVPCAVVRDADEARHWIELKHMGERGGAGSVLWGSEESARFRARTDPPEIHLQALDFLQDRGEIDQDYRSTVAVTTLRRLLGSPDVRSKLGLEWSDQHLRQLVTSSRSPRLCAMWLMTLPVATLTSGASTRGSNGWRMPMTSPLTFSPNRSTLQAMECL